MKLPRIVHMVADRRGRDGFLLQTPDSEALAWDIEHEIASTSRQWCEVHHSWWIAAPYLHSTYGILARFFPGWHEERGGAVARAA